MPTFENFAESQVTKMIYLGHTGAGKTGSLCSLASAGYQLRILDLDKGVEIFKDYLTNPKSIYTKACPGHWTEEQVKNVIQRVHYMPVDETVQLKGTNVMPKGDSWGKVMKLLNSWEDGAVNFGNVSSWGPKDILVIDGLSRLSQAAFNFQLAMGGRIGQRPEQSDYGNAQQLVERLLTMLYSTDVKCNVIMVCHIAYIETDTGPTRGFAQTIGKALSPKVGQYFNHALLAKASGQGEATKRVIVTNTSGLIELKSPAPLRVKAEYPLDTGLADYFRDVRGQEPPIPVTK